MSSAAVSGQYTKLMLFWAQSALHTYWSLIRAHKIFIEFVAEKEWLSKAAASLNTVRCKGKANIHILELSEDDCID